MTITIRSVFEEDGKLYPHVLLDDTISEGVDVNKTNLSKECDICHYWYNKDSFLVYD